MRSCAATDTVHTQKSYLTVARLTFTEMKISAKKLIMLYQNCHFPEW